MRLKAILPCILLFLVSAQIPAATNFRPESPFSLPAVTSAMATDSAGAVYLVGNVTSETDFNPSAAIDTIGATSASIFITRYNADGSYGWTKAIPYTGTPAGALVYNGRLYITVSQPFVNFNTGWSVLAVNTSTGMLVWLVDKLGAFSSATALTAAGSVLYVAGFSRLTAPGTPGAPDDRAFVSALDADTGNDVATFGTNGLVFYGDTGPNVPTGITISQDSLFLTGNTIQGELYVAAMDLTGAAQPTFANNGTFLGDNITPSSIVFNDGKLYVAGRINPNSITLDTQTFNTNGNEAFVAALDPSSGSLLTAFGSNGLFIFGGTGEEKVGAARILGNTLYLMGVTNSNDARVNGIGAQYTTNGGEDIFICAVSKVNGMVLPGFGVGGVKLIGGTGDEDGTLEVTAKALFTLGNSSGQAVLLGSNGAIDLTETSNFLLSVGCNSGIENFIAKEFQALKTISSMEVDSSGNVYVCGTFQNSIDFDPTTGVDEKTSLSSFFSAFVTRLNADGSYGWTQTMTGTGQASVRKMTIVNDRLYFAGDISGTLFGVGGAGSRSSGAYICALLLSTGAADTAFNGDGIQCFVGGSFRSIAAATGAVYACGRTSSGTVGFSGGPMSAAGSSNGLIIKVNASNGTPDTAFNGSGFFVRPETGIGAVCNAIVADASGAYVTGTSSVFQGPVAPALEIAFVERYSSAGVKQTTFNPIAPGNTGADVVLDGSDLYVCGKSGTGGYVRKIDATTGASRDSFGSNGTKTFGAVFSGVRVSASTVFAAGSISGTAVLSGEPDPVEAAAGGAFICALDKTTGAGNLAFSGEGVQVFGAGTGAGVAYTGNTVLLAGNSTATNAGLGGTGEYDLSGPGGFLVRLDATRGGRLLPMIVLNTNDSGPGSLRDVLSRIQDSDVVTFDPAAFDLTNSDSATVINLLSPLPVLSRDNITIDASDRRVTLNGSAAGTACGISVTSKRNRVLGMSIVNFTRSGICLMDGAKYNQIGGNRTVGGSPNGLGLRIAGCGAFGVEITGSGTDSNIVKGCWLGLDKSGQISAPNLAGVLIRDQAKSNTIGSILPAEANVISGNAFEGLTVSDVGTDDNVVVGNIIGLSAVSETSSRAAFDDSFFIPGRASLNGSSGAFLSKGTQRTVLGGLDPKAGNVIGFNGGSGIEVRALASRNNSARTNRISQNRGGGIRLFDGSNGGISAPSIDRVEVIPGRTSAPRGANSRQVASFHVVGSSSKDGTIELYNDPNTQGATFLNRVSAVGGRWELDLDADDAQALTATLTDVDGNTSDFGIFSTLPTGSGGEITGTPNDMDGDGVPDSLEGLAQTNPNDPADLPKNMGSLISTKLSLSVSFTKVNADSISYSLIVALPEGVSVDNMGVSALIGRTTLRFVLDTRGSSKQRSGSVKTKVLSSNGQANSLVSIAISQKALSTLMENTPFGFSDRTTTKEAVNLPVAICLSKDGNKFIYTGIAPVVYSAKQGKSGKAILQK